MGPFRIIHDGHGGLPAVCWVLQEGIDLRFTLYDLSDRLRARGWQVPAYSMPPNREDLVVQRILVRHGVSRDLGDLLLEDIRRSLATSRKASGLAAAHGDRGGRLQSQLMLIGACCNRIHIFIELGSQLCPMRE